jgi:predicted ATPase
MLELSVKNEEAFIFTGGGGVGKTSLVSNFLRRSYEYLGDDWILLGKQGIAYPFPKTVHVFDYNLKDEEIARRVLGSKRYYHKALFRFFDVGEKVVPNRYVRFLFQRFRPHLTCLFRNCLRKPR